MNATKEIIDDLESFKQQQIKLIYVISNNKHKGKSENKIVRFFYSKRIQNHYYQKR